MPMTMTPLPPSQAARPSLGPSGRNRCSRHTRKMLRRVYWSKSTPRPEVTRVKSWNWELSSVWRKALNDWTKTPISFGGIMTCSNLPGCLHSVQRGCSSSEPLTNWLKISDWNKTPPPPPSSPSPSSSSSSSSTITTIIKKSECALHLVRPLACAHRICPAKPGQHARRNNLYFFKQTVSRRFHKS